MFTTIGTRASRPTTRPYTPGLGVVGVEHVDALAPQDPPELARGAEVGRGSIERVDERERDVADALGFELGDPRSRAR